MRLKFDRPADPVDREPFDPHVAAACPPTRDVAEVQSPRDT